MSMVTRARSVTQGNITVNEGDVIITDGDKGVVFTDNVGDQNRVKVIDDAGTKTLQVEELS